jgi:hypothetical protein
VIRSNLAKIHGDAKRHAMFRFGGPSHPWLPGPSIPLDCWSSTSSGLAGMVLRGLAASPVGTGGGMCDARRVSVLGLIVGGVVALAVRFVRG